MEECSNLIIVSSLVFGVYLTNTITISCLGGAKSTICSVSVMKDTEGFEVQNNIVKGGTHNHFDNENKNMMGALKFWMRCFI